MPGYLHETTQNRKAFPLSLRLCFNPLVVLAYPVEVEYNP